MMLDKIADRLEAGRPRETSAGPLYRIDLDPTEMLATLQALRACGAATEKLAWAVERSTPLLLDDNERECHMLTLGNPALKIVVHALRIMAPKVRTNDEAH